MHPQGIPPFTLTLLFEVAIGNAFVVPTPGIPPSSLPEISKQNTDVIDESQPPVAVPTPTVNYPGGVPVRVRHGTTHLAGRKQDAARKEDSSRHGTDNENMQQAKEEKHGGTRIHRRDLAGMATPGFAILVAFAGIAYFCSRGSRSPNV